MEGELPFNAQRPVTPASAPDAREPFKPIGADALPFNDKPSREAPPPQDKPPVDPAYAGKTVEQIVEMHKEAQRKITELGTANAETRRALAEHQRAIREMQAALEATEDPDEGIEELSSRLPDGRGPTRGGGRAAPTGTMRSIEQLVEAKLEERLQAAQEAANVRRVEREWQEFGQANGIAPEDLEEVKTFFSKPENLTPGFLYRARHMAKEIQEARLDVANRTREGLSRTLNDIRTTAGNGGERGSFSGNLAQMLAEAHRRGDRVAVDKIRRQIYGVR